MSEAPVAAYNSVCVVCSHRWESGDRPLDDTITIGLCNKHKGSLLTHERGYQEKKYGGGRTTRKEKQLASKAAEMSGAQKRKHARGALSIMNGISAIACVEMKQAYARNRDFEVVGLTGFAPLVIRIRKCIACRKLFESISKNNCGCMARAGLSTSSMMGIEMIYASSWAASKKEPRRVKGKSDGVAPNDKLPSFGHDAQGSRQWIQRDVPRSGYHSE